MNVEQMLPLIEGRYGQVTKAGDRLFRAEEVHAGKTIGVFFFDFSQAPSDRQFDLITYLQKNLASDFYNHEGSLQWNYYLYFVVEKKLFEELYGSGVALKIESERTFARKYIREEKWLEEHLKKSIAKDIYESKPPKDIAGNWAHKLTEAGLGKICDPDAAYTRIVDDFLMAKPARPTALTKTIAVKTVPSGKHIRSIEINAFRDYPLNPTFEFGSVNLIRGVNGSGKTSLLEAIELSICGGIRRQGNHRPDGASVTVKFVGEDSSHKAPVNNTSHYRAIDTAWYGGYYRNVNKLPENFGRFNFFDSDAGFRLSQGTTAGEIRNAIEALFLGEQANTLEKIMVRCQGMFESKLSECDNRIQMRRSEISKIEADLTTLKKIKDNRETLLQEWTAKVKEAGWRKPSSQFNAERLIAAQESAEDLVSKLANCISEASWIPRVSKQALEKGLAATESCLNDLNKGQKMIADYELSRDKANDEIEAIDAELVILNRVVQYHQRPEAWLLRGGRVEMQKLKTKIEQIREAVRIVGELDLSPFERGSARIESLLKRHGDIVTAHKRTVAQKRRRLADLQKQAGDLRALVEEIKGLGRQLCEIDPSTKDCPLCATHYDDGLLKRINGLKADKSVNSALRDLTVELKNEERELNSAQDSANTLNRLKEAALLVMEAKELDSIALDALVQRMQGLPAALDLVQAEHNTIGARAKKLRLEEFTESELERLLHEAVENHEIPIERLSNAKGLITYVQTITKRRATVVASIAATNKQLKELQSEIDRQLKQVLRELDEDDDPLVELQRRITTLEEVLRTVRTGEQLIEISETEDLISVKNKLLAFAAAASRIKAALKQVEERDEFERKWTSSLEGLKSGMANLQASRERANQAITVLRDLVEGESKESYLREIMTQQRMKLVALFQQIHSPNEFKEVAMNGDVYLSRRNGKLASLSEISTGQRSALALSIFLSMNSSVGERAPWLIFDDPIAHVDDLNTLSFLDTLRELVLDGKRQLFFATANTRIANLFARKFDFLNGEFKEIALSRPE